MLIFLGILEFANIRIFSAVLSIINGHISTLEYKHMLMFLGP
jgi:hypothetical protein